MESPHKHHIIPIYHCEELGIDPDFDDNFVTIERIEHAQIHWEYYNGGYETLLKYIKPKPYVLMNIPFGDKRDIGAATITGRGEIDGIDISGENNPNYKNGKCVGLNGNPQARRAYQHSPEGKAEQETHRAKMKAETGYARGYSQSKKKTERQGAGTLDTFLK
tara:strand:- start:68 stop:556 length:489 start_codon:yes stop_codon:yes gene_type:complete